VVCTAGASVWAAGALLLQAANSKHPVMAKAAEAMVRRCGFVMAVSPFDGWFGVRWSGVRR
jgi:hypothetical protein